MSSEFEPSLRQPLPMNAGMLQLLSSGFVLSQVIFSGVELGVFDAIEHMPDPAEALATRLGLPAASLSRLLTALGALGLLGRDPDGTYRNTPLASAALTRESAASSVPFFLHCRRHLYRLFAELPDAIRHNRSQIDKWSLGGDPADCYTALSAAPAEYELFLETMDLASAGVGAAIAAQIDLGTVDTLVDLGCGGGRVARELCAAVPGLSVTAVDLPLAVRFAEARTAEAGFADRIRFVAGDLRQPLGDRISPADVVLLSAVIGDFDAAERAHILAGAKALLRPGGRVLVSETLFDEHRTGPLLPALLSLQMLLFNGGDNFTPREIRQMLSDAGFTDVEIHLNGELGLRDLMVGTNG